MARYHTDPLYDPRSTRMRYDGAERAFDREREMRGAWDGPPPDRGPTADEMRMAGEPWPYSPYASAPIPGTPGWHPPHLQGHYSDDHHPGAREWDWHDRPFRQRVSDEIAAWLGDDDAQRRRRADFTGVGPKGYRRPDARIEESLHEELTEDSRLDASAIRVTVKDGEVTLDGSVETLRDKRRAEDCADSVSGVGHVQNNLRVRNR